MIEAMIGAVIAVALLSSGPPPVQAQQIPPHVFVGSATIDGHPVPDGTIIVAYIDGDGVSKAVVEGGTYKLLVEQPPGQSYAGKIVQFTINDQKAEEGQPWEQGGANELNLHVDDATESTGGSLQDAIECTVRVLGRMPMGPQDMSDQERMQVFQACPAVRANLEDLSGGQQEFIPPGDGFRTELRQIEQEIARLQRETPINIQRDMERLDQEIFSLERKLRDELQFELDRLDQQRFDTENQMHRELQTADFRLQAQIEVKYRRILDNLERERFETERRNQAQIDQELGRLYRNRENSERQMWDEMQQQLTRLEQRRFELEDAIERERFAVEQRQRDEEDRRRFERERQMEEQRFKQQEELERQRIEQDRARFEQERKLEEERFRQQEQMDRDRIEQERQRMEQERRLDQERFNRESQLRTGQRGSTSVLSDPSAPLRIPRNLPTRGFFTNSSTGEISDIDEVMDPTSLAVLGILLTLVATSFSLVKGN